MNELTPFLKWAGGKRQLLPQIKERMPEKFDTYYEPFIGGGAVLFDLQPKRAVINDTNRALTNVYEQIKQRPNEFLERIRKLDSDIWGDGKVYYKDVRLQFNTKLMQREFDTEQAALFVFLNKHCFNGLYRVNKGGMFNVPFNNSLKASVVDYNILRVSDFLQNVQIHTGDFADICEHAGDGDFVFFDSPYAPVNPTSFTAYTKEGFSLEDHKRLAALFDELTGRGCYCMTTNHNTELIRNLYKGKGYRMDVVGVKRMINRDAKNRTGEEIIICNY